MRLSQSTATYKLGASELTIKMDINMTFRLLIYKRKEKGVKINKINNKNSIKALKLVFLGLFFLVIDIFKVLAIGIY